MTFKVTRARWRSPLPEHYQTVPGDGSVKRFNVPIDYTRARAADASTSARGATWLSPAGGKGLTGPDPATPTVSNDGSGIT